MAAPPSAPHVAPIHASITTYAQSLAGTALVVGDGEFLGNGGWLKSRTGYIPGAPQLEICVCSDKHFVTTTTISLAQCREVRAAFGHMFSKTYALDEELKTWKKRGVGFRKLTRKTKVNGKPLRKADMRYFVLDFELPAGHVRWTGDPRDCFNGAPGKMMDELESDGGSIELFNFQGVDTAHVHMRKLVELCNSVDDEEDEEEDEDDGEEDNSEEEPDSPRTPSPPQQEERDVEIASRDDMKEATPQFEAYKYQEADGVEIKRKRQDDPLVPTKRSRVEVIELD